MPPPFRELSPVTSGFRCEICSGLFRRRHLLRLHEQKCHGVFRTPPPQDDPTTTTPAERPAAAAVIPAIRTAAVVPTFVIPAIRTAALGVAKARGEVPFAMLHMRNDIPLIVRILDHGECSILKAAENSDFRESQRDGGAGLVPGSSVRIAIVATIVQRLTGDGKSYFVVTGPGSCAKPGALEPVAEAPQQQPTGLTDDILQDSLTPGDMDKTLNELNAPVLVPALRPHQVTTPQPPCPLRKGQKRKNTAKTVPRPAKEAPPAQPKVVAVVDDRGQCWDRPTFSRQRSRPINYQDMVTGPLLSPVRRGATSQNDPLATLDALDLGHQTEGGTVQFIDELWSDSRETCPPEMQSP